MSACPAPTPAAPALGQLLLERDSLECRLQRLTRKLIEADAYLESEGANLALGCYTRKVIRDELRGVRARLRAVRLEIAGHIGG